MVLHTRMVYKKQNTWNKEKNTIHVQAYKEWKN